MEIDGRRIEVLDPVPGVGAQIKLNGRIIGIGSFTQPGDDELWVRAVCKQAATSLLMEIIKEGGNPDLYLGC